MTHIYITRRPRFGQVCVFPSNPLGGPQFQRAALLCVIAVIALQVHGVETVKFVLRITKLSISIFNQLVATLQRLKNLEVPELHRTGNLNGLCSLSPPSCVLCAVVRAASTCFDYLRSILKVVWCCMMLYVYVCLICLMRFAALSSLCRPRWLGKLCQPGARQSTVRKSQNVKTCQDMWSLNSTVFESFWTFQMGMSNRREIVVMWVAYHHVAGCSRASTWYRICSSWLFLLTYP